MTSEVKREDRERARECFRNDPSAPGFVIERMAEEFAAHLIAAERATLERVERCLRADAINLDTSGGMDQEDGYNDDASFCFRKAGVYREIADELARQIKEVR